MPRPVVPILLLAGRSLAQLVEFAMQRQDQRGVLGDLEILAASMAMPRFLKPSISTTRVPGIEHHAVADHAELAWRTTPEGSSASL